MRIHRDSIMWLVTVTAVFALAVLVFAPLHMSLGWDETVYASQISQHEPIMLWSAERARGMPLLVAPVTLFTDSATVLRGYLAVLGGVGLFLALLAWRGIKPAWILALAGAIFGGLAIVQSQAAQLFPNFWIAIGGLAAVGLFVRCLLREVPSPGILIALAAATAFTALMRPVDALVICLPPLATAVVLIVRRALERHALERRATGALLAIAVGLAIGGGEWVAESFMYFGGPLTRMHRTSEVVGGTMFNPVNTLRILNGGRDSSLPQYPGIHGWSYPGLLVWWAVFVMLALVGVWAAARSEQGWLVAVMPLLSAVAVYLAYSLPVRDNARYLQPCWALLAIPAAGGIGWLILAAGGWRQVAAVTVGVVFLAVELGTQHVVLTRQWATLESAARANMNAVHTLRHLGVRPPCAIATAQHPYFAAVAGPASYYLGCRYVGTLQHVGGARGERIILLVQGAGQPWRYARHWMTYRMPAAGNVTAYLQAGTTLAGSG